MRRWLAWNLFFRLQETVKGHPTLKILREMERADRLSPAALDRLCRERLQDLLGYCYLHVPYVRTRMQEVGVKPSDIRGPEDLIRLPLLTKAEVRKNRETLRSDRAGSWPRSLPGARLVSRWFLIWPSGGWLHEWPAGCGYRGGGGSASAIRRSRCGGRLWN